MKNAKGSGDTITTVAEGNVVAGQCYHIRNTVCIPMSSASTGDSVVMCIRGSYELPKDTDENPYVGTGFAAYALDPAYFDFTNNILVEDNTAQCIGIYGEDSAENDDTAVVVLNGVSIGS